MPLGSPMARLIVLTMPGGPCPLGMRELEVHRLTVLESSGDQPGSGMPWKCMRWKCMRSESRFWNSTWKPDAMEMHALRVLEGSRNEPGKRLPWKCMRWKCMRSGSSKAPELKLEARRHGGACAGSACAQNPRRLWRSTWRQDAAEMRMLEAHALRNPRGLRNFTWR